MKLIVIVLSSCFIFLNAEFGFIQACQLDPKGRPCVYERWNHWDAMTWSIGEVYRWDKTPTEMDCRELCCRYLFVKKKTYCLAETF